jgi:hypothetical protein
VGIDPLKLHAELGDLSEADHEQVLAEAISLAKVAGTFTVPAISAAEQIAHAFRAAAPEAKDAAARAFVLSKVDHQPVSDLIVEAMAEAAKAGQNTGNGEFIGLDASASVVPLSLREDESTRSLRALAENLGDRGEGLISLFRTGDFTEDCLRLIVTGYRCLGFTDDEIRISMKPALDVLEQRNRQGDNRERKAY